MIFARTEVLSTGGINLSGHWLGTDRQLTLKLDPAPPKLEDLPLHARVALQATLRFPGTPRFEKPLIWTNVKVLSVEAMPAPEIWFSRAEQHRLGRRVEMSGVFNSWYEGDRASETLVHGWDKREGDCTDLDWSSPGYDSLGRWVRLQGTVAVGADGSKYVQLDDQPLYVFRRFLDPTEALAGR